jgi:hypothetical protein
VGNDRGLQRHHRPAASAARTSGATSSGAVPKGLDGGSINPDFIAPYDHSTLGGL